MTTLELRSAGPGLTLQDLGRPGHLATGLSRGGAADRLALLEAAALLSQPVSAAIEMAGMGGTFAVDRATRIALTGAPMKVTLEGRPLRWGASYRLEPGQVLNIGGVVRGSFGYLSVAGGFDTPLVIGSRSAHLVAGIGAPLSAGTKLPLGRDPNPDAAGLVLPQEDRFAGGLLRVMPGPQTALFSTQTQSDLVALPLTRSTTGNRQGVRLDHPGGPLAASGGLTVLSDLIGPGDIQMTGDGVPYILLAECQTMGGYPRIGTVIPADLPRAAQAAPGATFKLQWVTLEQAEAATRSEAQILADLLRTVTPLVRDPRDIADLLSYQLISGVVADTEF